MNVKVEENTHLNGTVMESRAEASKNHFKTQSLSYSDIENHSEVEVKSVSAGISTDMGQNAKNAMGAVASLLGNKQESEHSLTKSAISENIHIETETPENLTALLRDTANANQKVKAFDLEEIRERQEAAKVAGELFSKITGDVAKAFDFEDGSQEKILMHGIAGALAAKMGDGNIATGAAAGASSEWLNSYVADYLKAQTQGLNLEPQQKEKLRQAAQQATALMIGAVAGAVTGGSSETVKQGALASYNAESFNRQLHPDEIQWIEDNAKRFAKEESERLGYQVTEQEAKERLITQAAQEVDFAWLKKIGNTDSQAKSFLNSATSQGDVPPYDNRGTFINENGIRQTMFTANKDEYYSAGKYSEALAKFDKANNGVITKTLQPKVQYDLYAKSLSDGVETTVNGALYTFDNPKKVLSPINFGLANCLKENMCISAGWGMLKDLSGAVKQSGEDILGRNYNLKDVNYLYGKNMVNEIDTIAAVRGGSALLELVGVGKAASSSVKVASKAISEAAERTILGLPDLQTGSVIKPKIGLEELSKPLPEGYEYISLSEIKGPKGGAYHYVGDDGKGNPIFFNNNKFVSFEGGTKQTLSNTPAKLVFNGERLNPNLPEPVAGYEYKPQQISKGRTDVSTANKNSHINGYIHEIRLANAVAERPNTQVIKWGDSSGKHGSDIISVNTKTGEVELWDSKYRSNSIKGENSPTFERESSRLKAIKEAREQIEGANNLSPQIKKQALKNLDEGNFSTYTVGSGKVKNSVIQKYCNKTKC
ncbi:hypothetical protein BKK54_11270 [Rodentibacter genomosp. 1]|uniref:Toxin CdiA n=2 Tax=Rodentibacter genomosp. 1 TaxID=1908264 RepID=A0A1V3IZS7_9PAST|nr:hypothetical protein BKK54_11270 [Rodentibacter genomosp. 1]